MTIITRPHDEPAAFRTSNWSGCQSYGYESIDLGRIEALQVLDEHGNIDQARDPGLDDTELLAVHRAMVLTRAFDSRMLTMQRQGEMGTFAPNLGQEACMIGQVWELTKQDWFSPSYRSFGAQIQRGWPMERLFLLWSGYHEGFPPPEGVNDMPFSIVIGSHVLPAVGIAMGMRRRGDDDCVVVNFGDGAMSQGAVSEAFNFAMVDRAPVIFVCENNGWAISTPTKLQYATDHLAGRGVAFGLSSIRVDGNDILGMIAAMREATKRARDGEGPTFVEAVTYRMSLSHYGRRSDRLQGQRCRIAVVGITVSHRPIRGISRDAGCSARMPPKRCGPKRMRRCSRPESVSERSPRPDQGKSSIISTRSLPRNSRINAMNT